ncbi:DNA double-strand break repair nuclease NurA [Candidatus Woesearchaeota archaeon]|nr:DNA double-strand break repair nuclease NurA [Candidatus Woesearchaeota archaeon]
MFEEVIPEIVGKKDSDASEQSKTAISNAEFIPIEPQTLKACFVDGGNACVFDSPAARVEFIRVYGVIYDGKERKDTKKEEGNVLIRNDGKGNVIVKAYPPLELELSIPENHPELSFGKERVSLGTVANIVRFILECRFLKELGKNCDLLVRDGPLVPNNEYEKKDLKELLDTKLVAGLCKTNTLLTKTGTSASASFFEQGPKEPWITPFKKENDIYISIVKLNERSEYAFRLDTVEQSEKIAAALAVTAGDAAFPGYPYPLIEADRLGRVSNRELEALKTRFMAEAGEDWVRLKRLATGSDAHSVLDRLS